MRLRLGSLLALLVLLLTTASCGGDPLPSEVSLSVAKTGAGAGTVTSSPDGIRCGDDCGESYAEGATVTLSATPDGGSVLTAWEGCDGAANDTCTVVMSEDKSVTATFMPEVVTKQFGTSGGDFASAISVDDSGVYVAGLTEGSLEGSSAGNRDAFIRIFYQK